MKRPEINWTAVSTVLTGIGVVVALGSLQFSLSESTGRRIGDMRSDMSEEIRTIRSDMHAVRSDINEEIRAVRAEIDALRDGVQAEIGAFRAEVREEIGELRKEVAGEINSLRSDLREESVSNRERIRDLAQATAALIMKVNSIEEKILPENRADGDASPPDGE